MNPPFAFRPRARLDLLEQFLYLAEQATVEVAERYFHGARDVEDLFAYDEA
jgi:plasmid stabilization system protein ParE